MILVVGGTGTIGSELVRLLAGERRRVRLLVRDPFSASRLAGPGVEIVQGDLSRPETLPAALVGIQRIFLLTASGPETVPFQTAMIDAAAAAGIERLVRVSALGVGGAVQAGILEWHGAVEQVLAASGVPGINLRPASMMQNLLSSAEMIRRTGQFFGGQGDGRVAFIDARDVAAAAAGALTRAEDASENVALTGPESLSYGDLAAALTTEVGRPVTYQDLAAEPFRHSLIAAGLPEWLANDLSTLEDASRGTVMAASEGVTRLAGRPPRSFREFLVDHRALFA
jgi:uncharacterized protein YbjT (DUF2867 family)